MQTSQPPLTRRPWPLAAAVALVLTTACGGGAAEAPMTASALSASKPFGLTTVTLRPPGGDDAVDVPAYDAFHPETRQRGLMDREELPAGAGMVFRFPAERRGGFWMKNTLIPLSIAYFGADGQVLAVMDMPPCTQDPCPSYDPEVAYAGALEVNRGFFDDVGLTPGWRIEVAPGLPDPS